MIIVPQQFPRLDFELTADPSSGGSLQCLAVYNVVATGGQSLGREGDQCPAFGLRKTARMYGTPLYIEKNGKIIAEKP